MTALVLALIAIAAWSIYLNERWKKLSTTIKCAHCGKEFYHQFKDVMHALVSKHVEKCKEKQ